MNVQLYQYIETNIFPRYDKFYSHGMLHINKVIEQSEMIAKDFQGINCDMVYTVASYHDLGLAIDREHHELESGKILEADKELRQFFTEEQIRVMKEAVEDHRGSRKIEPRNSYGKIVSDADRDFDIEILAKRQLATSIKNYPDLTKFEEHFERCYSHMLKRKNKEGHFNLWTNHPTLIQQRDKYEEDFNKKEYVKEIYQKEYERMLKTGLVEKIINYYEDY